MLMVAFDPLLREPIPNVLNLRQDRSKRGRIDRRFVSHHLVGHALSALDRLSQERGGCGSIARQTNGDINKLAFFVDRAKRVAPPTGCVNTQF